LFIVFGVIKYIFPVAFPFCFLLFAELPYLVHHFEIETEDKQKERVKKNFFHSCSSLEARNKITAAAKIKMAG